MMALKSYTSVCDGPAAPGRIARMSSIHLGTNGIHIMSRFILHLALCALCGTLATASPDEEVPKKGALKAEAPRSFEGFWAVTGKEASGKPYSGIVTIERKGEAYLLHWAMQGGTSFVGVGIRTGDQLAVSWAVLRDETVLRGVNVYRIEGKTMSGRWLTLPGNGVIQTETLTFLKGFAVKED